MADKKDELPNAHLPLAYENAKFLNSPDGRILRIEAEYLEPLARFRRERIQDTVVFFGSARFHSRSQAEEALQLLDKPGSAKLAPPEEQARIRRAKADVEMARYYEDARQLAFLITQWTKTINQPRHRFVIATGGGPGIMEAANLGASEAGGKTIGLNINLPFEQMPNAYITPDLNFEFHYFFMRKLWFAYLAKALVVFPGGFGTFDELFELLTLTQTEKLAKRICIVVYGKDYWDRVINFQALVDSGTISPNDLELFHWANTPDEAFAYLREDLTRHHLESQPPRDKTVDIMKSRG
ncbi:MAG TPA: TIGR00730 family Rossman fold protein [Terriglobales bacterium]|jgi:hypothetical protein